MLCPNCGKEFENDTKVCPECLVEVKENPDTVVPEESSAEESQTETVSEEIVTDEANTEAVTEETSSEESHAEAVTEETQTAEAEYATKKKSIKDFFDFKTKLGKLVLGAAGVAVLGIIGISLGSGGSDKYNPVEISEGYYIDVEDEMLINLSGDVLETDEYIYDIDYSSDYSLTVVEDADDVLYVVTKKGVVEIDEEVERFWVSAYGDTVAYMKEVEDGVGELYLYHVSNKKSTLIDEEAYEYAVVLSPDGKTVAYVGNCEIEYDWYDYLVTGDLFVSKNLKKGEKVYSDAMPIGISNSGKYVYYVKDAEKLYVNEEKISSDFSDEFWFNKDLSELIFNDEGRAQLFLAKKNETIQLKKDSFTRMISPGELVTSYNYLDDYDSTVYDVDTFNETVMRIGGNLYFMSKNGEELEKISGDIARYQMAADGKGFLYLDYDGDLYYIKDITKTTDAEKIADDLDINRFYASEDLKKIYYVSDDELFYLTKGKGTRIADVEQCVYSDEFGVIFFSEDEELFYATTSSKSKEKIMGETVNNIEILVNVLLFSHVDDDEVERIYRLTGKDKYKLIYEED